MLSMLIIQQQKLIFKLLLLLQIRGSQPFVFCCGPFLINKGPLSQINEKKMKEKSEREQKASWF